MKPLIQPMNKTIFVLLVLLSTMGVNCVWADEDGKYNQIRFEARSTEQVKNDRMQAVLNVFGEDQDPSSLADRINRTMDWALSTAADYENVQTKTGGYR
ncbi:MAG: hypothetical protein V3S33_06285, partial [Gammaproteobacteria bacterium]